MQAMLLKKYIPVLQNEGSGLCYVCMYQNEEKLSIEMIIKWLPMAIKQTCMHMVQRH